MRGGFRGALTRMWRRPPSLRRAAGSTSVPARWREAGAPPAPRARRAPLVSGVFRARRRLRPRQPADSRGARRRRLHRERPEDLDVVRRQGRLDVPPRPYGSRGAEARRHHVPADGHGLARGDGASHQADQRGVALLRDLPDGRACARAERRRARERGLGDRQDAAPLRAEHDRRRLQGARRCRAPPGARPPPPAERGGPPRPPDRARSDRPARDGPGLLRLDAGSLAGADEGGAPAGAGDVDLQVLRDRAEPAPARPGGPHRGTPGPRLGGRGLRRRGAQARARLAPLARQLDRGRHVGGPAEHHRQARARPARLMALVLTEEQELLGRTAREFVAARSPVKRIRQLRDSRDPVGFSRELWREMARLGWVGILIPEGHGGAGLGHTDLMVVLEELGRGLVPEPMLSTVLLGSEAVLLGGSEAQRSEQLPAVAGGDRLLALAYQERRNRYDPHHVETRAERAGGGWRLTGEKIQVVDGHVADLLVVSARSSGQARDAEGITLFLTRRDA